MPRKPRVQRIQKRRPTHIKAWRLNAGLTQPQMVERLLVECEYEIDVSQLSRIERAEQPYSQDFLEAVATVFGCGPEDLLYRNPNSPENIQSIYDALKPPQQRQAVEILKTIQRTGTE